MLREIDGCKGCGMSPCYNCKEFVKVCDECDEEADKLFDVCLEGLAGSVCKDCIRDYIKENINEITDLIAGEYFEEVNE